MTSEDSMTERPTQEDAGSTGAVERLVRDDVERQRFLKMAGKGLGGAAITTSPAALTKAIKPAGDTPVKKPTFTFPVTDRKSFLALTYTRENVGVGAYNGAGPSLKSKELLAAAGEFVQTEARHAAMVAMITGQSITPHGWDR
jgi:hypothetical protein